MIWRVGTSWSGRTKRKKKRFPLQKLEGIFPHIFPHNPIYPCLFNVREIIAELQEKPGFSSRFYLCLFQLIELSIIRILLPLPRRRGLHIVRDDFFMLRSKSHLSLIPSLLLSKTKPHGRFMPRRQLRPSAVLGFVFGRTGQIRFHCSYKKAAALSGRLLLFR